MPDAVTLAPGRVSRLSPCVSLSLRSDARCCDAVRVVSPAVSDTGCVSRLSPCVSHLPLFVTLAPGSCFPLVSQSLRSDARCVDAGFEIVSPPCLPVSPSLCGRMLDAVTPAPSRLSPRVSQSLRSDARCCALGPGRVSRLSPCVSCLRGQMPDAVTLALGRVSRLFSCSPCLCGQAPDAAPGLCLPRFL